MKNNNHIMNSGDSTEFQYLSETFSSEVCFSDEDPLVNQKIHTQIQMNTIYIKKLTT